MGTAGTSRTAVASHSQMVARTERPCARIATAPTSASGKLAAKIPASRARLPPERSPAMDTPRARFSGTPSRMDAASRASPTPEAAATLTFSRCWRAAPASSSGSSATSPLAAAAASSSAGLSPSATSSTASGGAMRLSSQVLMPTKTAAPASTPQPAGATPPSSTASGNSSKARADTMAPLAKASMTPVTRSGASQ
jgi:hypothetical protein